jgi:hypothetical protein
MRARMGIRSMVVTAALATLMWPFTYLFAVYESGQIPQYGRLRSDPNRSLAALSRCLQGPEREIAR